MHALTEKLAEFWQIWSFNLVLDVGRYVIAAGAMALIVKLFWNLGLRGRKIQERNATSADMRREILALQRQLGITMLYVTHDQTEAMAMADQIVLLRSGRVEQDAPPAEIYAHPATSFAASFLGTPPMNLFPLDRVADGLVVRGTASPVVAPTVPGELLGGIRPENLRLAESGIERNRCAVADHG